MFIPFLGAYVKYTRGNPWQTARVALAGPILGGVASLACPASAESQNSDLLDALAYFGFFLNLFNLLPFGILDGGRSGARRGCSASAAAARRRMSSTPLLRRRRSPSPSACAASHVAAAPSVNDDRILLDHPRAPNIDSSVAKIAAEFSAGFEHVAQIDRPAVAMFGSARVTEGSAPYEAARAAGRRFAEPAGRSSPAAARGVMEGANRGAQEGGGLSVGFNIKLPHEQGANPYLDISLHVRPLLRAQGLLRAARRGLRHLPRRLRHARRALRVADVDPDRQIQHFPVVLFDSDYWGEMVGWIRGELLADGMISAATSSCCTLTDDPADAVGRARLPRARSASRSSSDAPRRRRSACTMYGPGGVPPGP